GRGGGGAGGPGCRRRPPRRGCPPLGATAPAGRRSASGRMHAVVVEKPGGLEALALREVPAPEPAPDEVLIEVAWAGVNWSDVQKRRGVYPDPVTYPAIIGLEVSGRVAAVGSAVREVAVGARVAALTGPWMLGGYAERVAVPAPYV